MVKEFNLSEKILRDAMMDKEYNETFSIPVKDVKEFIRKLKEDIKMYFLRDNMPNRNKDVQGFIDKFAGLKLNS